MGQGTLNPLPPYKRRGRREAMEEGGENGVRDPERTTWGRKREDGFPGGLHETP